MSNWISINPDNLSDVTVDALVQACRSAALGQNQTDPSPRVIQSVVDRIRAEVAGCRTNQVDADLTTIPKSLYLLAMRMIMSGLKGRLQLSMTDDERTQLRSDERYLERISSCQVPIDLPDNPITAPVEPHAGVQVTSRPHCPIHLRDLEGLV